MRLLGLLTGSKSTAPAGRTPRERARREREIRKIDARTTAWLQAGGLAPKRGGR